MKCGLTSGTGKRPAGCGKRSILTRTSAGLRFWSRDHAFLEKSLLQPFGIRRFLTDGWGAYQRHLAPIEHEVSKHNTQQIERKHLTLRTRIKCLARKTICFSKSIEMHDTVIGLFINRYEFGLAV
jgi:insertion element IS1 protein InsB